MAWDDRIGRRIKLKDLHMLEVVARCGSMARAAEDLGLTQAAVSKAISEMEGTIGTTVFTRTSRGATLTESGSILLRRGRTVFDELRQGLIEIASRADPAQGEIRIGTLEHLTPFVANVINALTRQHRRIAPHIVVGDATALLRGLQDRALDIVIARATVAENDSELVAKNLFRDRLVVVTGADNPLSRRKKVALAELSDERWVLSPPDAYLGRLVAEALRQHNFQPPIGTVYTLSVKLRLDLIQNNGFLSLYSTAMLQHPSIRGQIRALSVVLDEHAGPISLITLRSRFTGGPLKLFTQAALAGAKAIAAAELAVR